MLGPTTPHYSPLLKMGQLVLQALRAFYVCPLAFIYLFIIIIIIIFLAAVQLVGC